jgi:hypothetical protein
MTLSRWLSLIIVTIYALAFLFSFPFGKTSAEDMQNELYHIIVGSLIWLGISLGLIWYGGDLGEGLIGAKWGWVDSPSPGWAIQLFGWIFLLAPAALFFWKMFTQK